MSRARLIRVARGQAPADLLFVNARVINVFTAEIEEANVAVADGRIAGIGDYSDGEQIVDLKGKYLAPSLIDGHVHVESSYLNLPQYARAVVPRGTGAVVTDLHEIANVCGMPGVRYMLRSARRLPFNMFVMAPSCVPCTDHLETSGARLGPAEIRRVLGWPQVLGLGEMMNFPGVWNADPQVLAKVEAGRDARKIVDGHAPRLSGRDLNAYVAAGIQSCHETTQLAEGRDKLRRGIHLMIREGSSEKNLEELLPLVSDDTYPRCMLVVDDRTCLDLLRDGDMDAVVRKAIQHGLDPIRAIQLATINPADYFRMEGLGAVAPGYWANLIVVADLREFRVESVYYQGRLVAQDGVPLFDAFTPRSRAVRNTVTVRPFGVERLKLPYRGGTFPVMQVVPGQIITIRHDETPKVEDGLIVSDTERDLLKAVVIERHHATGNIGIGLAKGFGLKRGAIASSVAHDSHNIEVVGVTDEDIYVAAQEVIRMQGGLAVVADGQVLGSLALPVAGLLTDEPLEVAADQLAELQRLAAGIGCTLPSPFATLSFIALPVIPDVRITDRGVVDVMAGTFVA